MRGSVLAAFLVAVVALAGCSGKESSGPTVEDGGEGGDGDGDGPRRSVGQGGEGNETTYDSVRFFTGDLQLVGAASQGFDTTVPANVTLVDFSIESPELGSFTGLSVELAGCGSYLASGTFITNGGTEGRVCNDATSGTARLTVSNTGFVRGSITLVGKVPRAPENATADATALH